MGGGGSGGGGTTQSVSNQYSSLSPWAAPYVTAAMGAAQHQVFQTDANGNITGMNPYNAFGTSNGQGGQYGMTANDMNAANASVANFSGLQNQSFQNAANLQTPGQYGQATNATQYGIDNAFQMGANANPQNFQQNVGGYMNPYVQNALNPALQVANQQYGIAGQQEQGAATGRGAFGGSREALMASLNQQNQMLANNSMIGQGYNNAFNAAQNQYNQSNQFALGANQTGVQNAGQLAAIGGQQNATNLANIAAQNTYGQQQTAGQQAIINQAMQNYQTGQQYPWTQLQNMKNVVPNVNMTDTTQTIQQAAPSSANIIGGAGMSLTGAALASSGNSPTIINNTTPVKGAQGGILSLPRTKKMNSGGIGAIYRKALNDPASVPDQSIKDGVIPKGLPANLVQAMKANEKQQAQAPAQAPTSTVIQDIDAKEQQQQAQAQALDEQKLLQQLPVIMADLKVARDIAKEKGDKEEVKLIDQKIAEVSMLAQRAQEKMQMQPAQGQGPMTAPPPQGIDAAMAQQQQQQAAMAQQPQTQAPQQMGQAPQGIAQGAGGGIVAFNKGGAVQRYNGLWDSITSAPGTPVDPSDSGFVQDVQRFRNWASEPTIIDKAIEKGHEYFFKSRPTTADREDAEAGPSTSGKTPALTPSTVVPTKTDIVIGPRPNRESKEYKPTVSTPPLEQYDVKGATNDVTKMIENWSNMLNQQYNKDTTMQDIGRGLMRGGAKWASYAGAGTGVGQGIAGASEGYLESTLASEAKKDKILTQMMSLGMSGAQLKMEAAKLGIAQEELKAKLPELAARARYYNARANAPIGGAGLVAPGPINPSDLMKIDAKFDALKNNPKSDPAFYNSLPPTVQKQLDLPKDSAGYKTGMQNVEIIVRNQKNTFIQRAHREGARYKTSQSSSDSDE